jgi:hypothetical protein
MKLTRRRKVGLSLAGLVICIIGLLAIKRMQGVSTAAASRIAVGMSKADVEAILGPAPTDDIDFTRNWSWTFYSWDRWQVTDGHIDVGFDTDMRVNKVMVEVTLTWERLYDKALRKLRLRTKRSVF